MHDGKRVTGFRDVIMHNDDETPIELVVHVLTEIIGHDPQTARNVALTVQENGSAKVGSLPAAVAQAKVDRIVGFARQEGYPLRCELAAS
jgi:ATP-dependent Clp protease adaptor protein ClpS